MPENIEAKLLSTFASVAAAIGYSEVHGRIIAALIIAQKPLSMQELAKRTGYSLAAISLSLDLLELVGIVRKIKNPSDRRLYARLEGDVLQGLRNALILKVQKEIFSTLAEFEKYRSDARIRPVIANLEKEIRRLQRYVDALGKVEIPKE